MPNNLHAEMAIAAAKAGKMILCEKPLGFNVKDAEKMVAAVERRRCRTWCVQLPAVPGRGDGAAID